MGFPVKDEEKKYFFFFFPSDRVINTSSDFPREKNKTHRDDIIIWGITRITSTLRVHIMWVHMEDPA